LYWKLSQHTSDPTLLASLFINALRHYTRQVWAHRNQVLHGATVEENANIVLNKLREEVTAHYQHYSENNSYALQQHAHLFLNRTLSQRLAYSYDYLSCWLRSVKEARTILVHQEAHLRSSSTQFFSMFHLNSNSSLDAISPDSTYVPLPSEDSTTTSMTLSTQSMTSGSATIEDSCSDSSSLSSNQAYLSLFFDDTTSSITSTPEETLLLEEHLLC
jgi:hypothetical protein